MPAFSAEAIAEVCHEANRVVQRHQADHAIPVSPPWAEIDAETKQSIVEGVVNAIAGTTPEESHANWVTFKMTHGWTLGPVKDLEAKTHPLLVPYAQLPAEQKRKDDLFLAIVSALK